MHFCPKPAGFDRLYCRFLFLIMIENYFYTEKSCLQPLPQPDRPTALPFAGSTLRSHPHKNSLAGTDCSLLIFSQTIQSVPGCPASRRSSAAVARQSGRLSDFPGRQPRTPPAAPPGKNLQTNRRPSAASDPLRAKTTPARKRWRPVADFQKSLSVSIFLKSSFICVSSSRPWCLRGKYFPSCPS